MLSVAVTRLRLATLVFVVALSGAGWQHVGGAASTTRTPDGKPQTFDAATLIAALPLRLVPSIDPGARFVSLIASDIDADGDLDLVGNEGSLELIVWINNGTGVLTRRYAGHSSGWQGDSSTATGANQRATVSVLTPVSTRGLSDSLTSSLIADGAPRAKLEPPVRDASFARPQSPRAPPPAPLSI